MLSLIILSIFGSTFYFLVEGEPVKIEDHKNDPWFDM